MSQNQIKYLATLSMLLNDIVLLLEINELRFIQLSAPPCTADPCPSYEPSTAVDRVIELRGGRATELGVKVGDRIKIEFFH